MTGSATEAAAAGRSEKAAQTRARIVACAQELCLDRGFDGFTMEDLAAAAGVSRRTLFNYFPGKVDAVLGGDHAPDFREGALVGPAETFRTRGPHGVLAHDLAALARHFLDTAPIERQQARYRREVLTSSPRILTTVHERFEQVAHDIAGLILEREGAEFGPVRARLTVALLVAVFDTAMEIYSQGPDDGPGLADLFTEHLLMAGELLAH